jgi:hypothetical protein
MINPGTASSINAAILIGLGIWEMTDSGSPICLIPVFLGAILLVFSQGVRADNQTQLKLSLIFTILIIATLSIALGEKLSMHDIMGKLRVSVMILSSVWASVVYVFAIRSFR